jgi:hypothetical protein
MRFDPARVMETVKLLDAPEFAGVEGEGRTADYMEDRLSAAGFHIERNQAVPARVLPQVTMRLAWIGFGLVMTASALCPVLLRAELAPLLGIPLFVLGLSGGAILERWRFSPWGKQPPMLVARRPAGATAPVRVVFHTPIGSIGSSLHRDHRWLSLGFLAFTLGICSSALSRRPQWLAPLSLGVGLVFYWFEVIRRARRSVEANRAAGTLSLSDRAGPAFLLELARAWPESRSERIEAVFVASAPDGPMLPGNADLLRRLRSEWRSRPTLLIVAYGPGLGRELIIEAFAHRQLARASAEGLWVPVRFLSSNPFAAAKLLWPLHTAFPDHVVLAGSESLDQDEPALDQSALCRTEQLVSEIALRWARQAAAIQDPVCFRNDARSAQNPG